MFQSGFSEPGWLRKRRRAGKWAGVRKKKGKSNGRDTDSTAGVMDGAEGGVERERMAGFIYKKIYYLHHKTQQQ